MNVIFDLGGVVFHWRPDRIIESVIDDLDSRAKVKAEIFAHADWLELDRGVLSKGEAIERGASRTNLPKGLIERLISAVPRSLTPIAGSFELIEKVKQGGHRLFVLSNMQFESVEYLEKEHSIWDMFDDVVFSCRINKVKPDPEIYEYLLETNDLRVSDTCFIDDTEMNLTAACRLGIHPIQFENAVQCERELRDWENFRRR